MLGAANREEDIECFANSFPTCGFSTAFAELLPKSIAILRWRWLVRKTQHPVPLTQKRGCGGTHLRHFVDGKKLINTLKPIAACGENAKEERSGDEQPEVSASNKVVLNAKSDPFQHYSIGRRLGVAVRVHTDGDHGIDIVLALLPNSDPANSVQRQHYRPAAHAAAVYSTTYAWFSATISRPPSNAPPPSVYRKYA